MHVRLCKIQELTSQTVNERFCRVQAFSKNSTVLDFVRFRYCPLLYTSCQNLKKLGVSVLTQIGFVTLRVFRLHHFFFFCVYVIVCQFNFFDVCVKFLLVSWPHLDRVCYTEGFQTVWSKLVYISFIFFFCMLVFVNFMSSLG